MRSKISQVFTWLERRFETDVRYLARGSAWLMTSQVVLAVFSLASAWAFANLISQDTFGHYRFALSIVGILALTTLTGMSTAVTRAASRGFGATIRPALLLKIRWGLGGMVAGLCVAGYYAFNDNLVLASAVALGSLFIPFKDTFSIFDALLQAARRFDLSTYYRLITQAVSLVCMVTTLFLTNNLLLILLSYLLPLTVMQIFFYNHTLQHHPLEGGVDHEALRYGKHLSILGALGGFTGHFQNIMLFHFLGAPALAMFYFAVAPTEQMRSVTSQVEPILFPKIASDEWKLGSFGALFKKYAPFLLLVTGGALLYIGLAPFFFSIFFPQYMNTVLLSQLFAPTIIVTATNTLLMTIVKAKGMLKIQYLTNAVDTVFGLGVNIVLIYFFGLYGLIAGIMLMKGTELMALVWTLFHPTLLQAKQ